MAIVRKRAMMPSVMSVATEIAVPCARRDGRSAGSRADVVEVGGRPPAGRRAGAECSAEHVDEQQEEDDRHATSSSVIDG